MVLFTVFHLLRVNWRIRVNNFFEPCQNLSWFSVATYLFLRENEVAIDDDVKNAFTAGDECQFLDNVLIM